MKRLFGLVLTISIILSMTACSQGANVQSGKIEVIDVTNMTIEDASKALADAGFTNITSNIDLGTSEGKWIVTEQSVIGGTKIFSDTAIELTCKKMYQLYIDISSESNIIFNKYDVEIYLDEKELGTVANGKSFSTLVEVLEGDHELIICKAGESSKKASKNIVVNADMTFSCDVGHGSSIELKNISTVENIDGASLKMIDVTGEILSEAMNKLKEIGFKNLREEPYGNIWDEDNWIVTNQGVAAGTFADNNTFIQLDCISLDTYFEDAYVGKSVLEIQKLAEENGFFTKFQDSSRADLDSKVAAMGENAKEDWIATAVRQYSGADKTAIVTITNSKEDEKSSTSQETANESNLRSNEDDAVSYSTNDKQTVKNGNTGVYSYKSRGGTYDIYYVIDFDDGYVYYFTEGNGNSICERVRISSGDLNNVLIMTYHDGDSTWSYGLHFKWKNQPDILIVQDEDGFEYEYYSTNLKDAEGIRYSKTICDY